MYFYNSSADDIAFEMCAPVEDDPGKREWDFNGT